jgi:sugar transferase (PEP-CTERM/EpsH1 system associated)
MKLLFITARFPYPPVKGDKAIPYYRLKTMAQEHEITLLTFYESAQELTGLERVAPFCKEVITVKKSLLRSLFNMTVWGLFSRLPFQVLYYRSRKFTNALKELTARENFDLIHVYMLRIAWCAADANIPKVLELIDSMQLNFQRRAEQEKWPLKLLFYMELKRLKGYENRMVRRYDRCIVVSDKDRQTIGHPNAVTIPLGIDTDLFRPPEGEKKPGRVIAFTGNMGYFPNRNAISWFLEHCWPLVLEEVPDAQLKIAGPDPGTGIKKYHDGKRVHVTGFVESMPKVLQEARAAIAPMRSGSGMQFKILEAMACGVPVAATSMGLGSIPAEHDKHILLADEPESFARHCVKLLTDDSLRERIGNAGLDMVRRNFSWEKNVSWLHNLYQEIFDGGLRDG